MFSETSEYRICLHFFKSQPSGFLFNLSPLEEKLGRIFTVWSFSFQIDAVLSDTILAFKYEIL